MWSQFPSRNGHFDCDCAECCQFEAEKLQLQREIDDFLLVACDDGAERAALATACGKFISLTMTKPGQSNKVLGQMIKFLSGHESNSLLTEGRIQ